MTKNKYNFDNTETLNNIINSPVSPLFGLFKLILNLENINHNAIRINLKKMKLLIDHFYISKILNKITLSNFILNPSNILKYKTIFFYLLIIFLRRKLLLTHGLILPHHEVIENLFFTKYISCLRTLKLFYLLNNLIIYLVSIWFELWFLLFSCLKLDG